MYAIINLKAIFEKYSTLHLFLVAVENSNLEVYN